MHRAFSLFCIVAACASAQTATRLVVSVPDLAALGIAVERMQLSTPMASVEVGSLVDPAKAAGKYEFTECVVLGTQIAEPHLAAIDADASGVVRRTKSTKARSIFLVRGREQTHAYLAFQFSGREGESTQVRRYLLPIARLGPESS